MTFSDKHMLTFEQFVACPCGLCLRNAQSALPAVLAEIRRLQVIETAVKELRAMDDAWLRRHPHYRRPHGVVLPHDNLYALLDATHGD